MPNLSIYMVTISRIPQELKSMRSSSGWNPDPKLWTMVVFCLHTRDNGRKDKRELIFASRVERKEICMIYGMQNICMIYGMQNPVHKFNLLASDASEIMEENLSGAALLLASLIQPGFRRISQRMKVQ